MRKLFTFVFLLFLCGTARAEFITRVDCGTYTAAINDTTACLQTTTVSGRTAGHLYVRRAGAWVDVDTSGSGAPTTATYITQTADAGLSAEQALGALATGILKSTTTTGVVSIAVQGADYYAPGGTDVAVVDGGTGRSTLTLNGVLLGNGSSAINMTDAGTAGQVLTSNGAGSPPTFQTAGAGSGTVTSVATNAPLTGGPITTTGTVSCPTCLIASAPAANRLIIGSSGQNLTTVGSLGTTTTVLHGNAAGAPTFGAVSLTADVTGALVVNNGGTGITSGTSGGIPYFSSSSTIASSAALTANLPVIGGGAGVAPSVGTRSGNTTAFVTTTGSLTSGRCVEIDANGNFIQAAAACGSGAGSVTSVGQTFTGGLISVSGSPITTSGTLALTVAGTSGGIPYFSGATTWASSGALTANLPVIGGGAGAAPTVGTRSGNTTAFVTTTGSLTSGRCVEIDANGNFIQSAAGCGAAATFQAILFRPAQNEPPTANFATFDTRNGHPVLDFDGTTDEEAVFSGVLPDGYTGGGLTVDTWWSFTSATSGSLRVQAAIERIDVSSLDIDADSFASFQSAGGSAPGTTGQVIKVSITFTNGAQMDSLAAGEAFRLKIRRDADGTSGTDDITTDAELLMVQVKET
jgi:hypothetical protein